MKGITTNIQRFSLNDGPGIRSTIFFKGCTMQCRWCHNPETISLQPELLYYESRCIGCGKCFSACRYGAHKMEDGRHIVNRKLCTNCGECVEVCSTEALVMSGQEMSTDEVMKEILQDKPYYLNSGGGITISGGEVSCQQEFAEEIVERCHANGISTAIETNLYYSFDKMLTLLSKLDLIMLDIKLFDAEEHHKWVGTDNQLVLKNVKKVEKLGIPIIVRTPLIPDVTDTEHNLIKIAGFLKGMENLLYYELLNFNPLGASKYEALGRENMFADARPLCKERLEEIKSLLGSEMVRVRIGG